MSKAIEDALNRLSPEQKARYTQQIKEAGQNLYSAQMKDVEQTPSYSNAPSQTPANAKGLEEKKLDPSTHAHIESVQQGKGNNYQYQNEVDRVNSRSQHQAQQSGPQRQEPEQGNKTPPQNAVDKAQSKQQQTQAQAPQQQAPQQHKER